MQRQNMSERLEVKQEVLDTELVEVKANSHSRDVDWDIERDDA